MDKIKPVLDWIKGHLLIVIFSVIAVAALGAGWFVSSGMRESALADAEDQAKKINTIATLERTNKSIPLPGRSAFEATGVLNQQFVDAVRELAGALSADAAEARELALSHNGDPWPDRFPHPVHAERMTLEPRAGAKQLFVSEALFPSPPLEQRNVLGYEVQRGAASAYARLLEELGTGGPLTPAAMGAELNKEKLNIIQRDLGLGTESELSDDQAAEVAARLAEIRINRCADAARDVRFYAVESLLPVPTQADVDAIYAARDPDAGLAELYGWHWDYWIIEDILRAMGRVNVDQSGEPVSVATGPVKRLMSIDIDPMPLPAPSTGSGSGGRSMTTGGFSGGGRGAATPGAPGGSTGPLPEPIVDMSVQVSPDFSMSLTGRTSNAVYDVRNVRLAVHVETQAIPRLIDALSKQNFMTVLDVAVQPADSFAAMREGFFYGREPIARVDLTIETVWFRKWTAPWMPEAVRGVLGIQSAPAGAGSRDQDDLG